jgi:hypothetical protein
MNDFDELRCKSQNGNHVHQKNGIKHVWLVNKIVNKLRRTSNKYGFLIAVPGSFLVDMIDSVHPESGSALTGLKKSRRKTSISDDTPKIDRLAPNQLGNLQPTRSAIIEL